MRLNTLTLVLGSTLFFALSALAQPPAPAPPTEPARKSIVEELQDQAKALDPLVKSDAVKCFLRSTDHLRVPTERTVWRTPDKSVTYSEEEYSKLDPKQQAGLVQRDFPPEFYYLTGYGSPLMYARPLDLYAAASGVKSFTNLRITDFGYGTIGHLRLLALQGARTVGIDVEPILRALYTFRGDTGDIFPNPDCVAGLTLGHIDLICGRWPADKAIADQVAAISNAKTPDAPLGFDLFISKNTLKRGYIHPARAVDEKFLVKLGVDDATYCRAVFDSIKPGGYFLIYNLSPAQAPADKPYLPHADGQCPFERSLLEKTGFEVIEFDKDERAAALDFWMTLGFNDGKSREETHKDLFAWYTLCRRPPANTPAKPGSIPATELINPRPNQ